MNIVTYAVSMSIATIISFSLFGFGRRRGKLSSSEVDDFKNRVENMLERTTTQFVAAPGDPRLKDGWEYLVASQPNSEMLLTATYFTREGISRTQTGLTENDIFALAENEGWHINGQSFTPQGRSWQLERLIRDDSKP